MYLNAFNIDLIPRERFLSLNSSSIETRRSVIDTNMSPVEAQKYTIDLSIGWLAPLAELLGLTTFILTRNRESDIYMEIFQPS